MIILSWIVITLHKQNTRKIREDTKRTNEFGTINPHVESSLSIGGAEFGPYTQEQLVNKIIGKCPEAELYLGSVSTKCLIDTGAEVSTLTETFSQAFETFREGTVGYYYMAQDNCGEWDLYTISRLRGDRCHHLRTHLSEYGISCVAGFY